MPGWNPGADPFPATTIDKITDLEYLDELKFVRHATVHTDKTPRSLWQLSANFRVRMTAHPEDGEPYALTIEAPRGLHTDLASVPKALWWVVGPIGRHLEASIIHDYLYMAWTDFRATAMKRDRGLRRHGLPCRHEGLESAPTLVDLRRRAFADRLGRLPQEALHAQGTHGRVAATPRRRPRPRGLGELTASGELPGGVRRHGGGREVGCDWDSIHRERRTMGAVFGPPRMLSNGE